MKQTVHASEIVFVCLQRVCFFILKKVKTRIKTLSILHPYLFVLFRSSLELWSSVCKENWLRAFWYHLYLLWFHNKILSLMGTIIFSNTAIFYTKNKFKTFEKCSTVLLMWSWSFFYAGNHDYFLTNTSLLSSQCRSLAWCFLGLACIAYYLKALEAEGKRQLSHSSVSKRVYVIAALCHSVAFLVLRNA